MRKSFVCIEDGCNLIYSDKITESENLYQCPICKSYYICSDIKIEKVLDEKLKKINEEKEKLKRKNIKRKKYMNFMDIILEFVIPIIIIAVVFLGVVYLFSSIDASIKKAEIADKETWKTQEMTVMEKKNYNYEVTFEKDGQQIILASDFKNIYSILKEGSVVSVTYNADKVIKNLKYDCFNENLESIDFLEVTKKENYNHEVTLKYDNGEICLSTEKDSIYNSMVEGSKYKIKINENFKIIDVDI